MALVSLMVFMAMFSLGLGGIPWCVFLSNPLCTMMPCFENLKSQMCRLMMSEIFPSQVSGIASGVLTMIQWTLTFVVTLSFNPFVLRWRVSANHR